MIAWRIIGITCVGLLGLGACQGDLDLPNEGSTPDHGPIADAYVYPDMGPGTPDIPVTDGAPPGDTGPSKDGSGGPGDASPVPDAPAGAGTPCPCKPPLLCVDKICRQPCAVPTDPCKAISNCPPTHGCVPMTNRPNTAACLPGLAAGQPCQGGSTPCVVQHVCASSGGSAMICLPICTMLGAPCGTQGGTCVEHKGCKFCSKP